LHGLTGEATISTMADLDGRHVFVAGGSRGIGAATARLAAARGARIRVNCIAPAWTDTDMARPAMESIGMDQVVAVFPSAASVGRKTSPSRPASSSATAPRSSPEPRSPSTAAWTCGVDLSALRAEKSKVGK